MTNTSVRGGGTPLRILVTGAGGFVGKRIATSLIQEGYIVVGVVRQIREEYAYPIVVCNLAEPFTLQNHFDVIVHAAGSLPYKENDFIKFKQNNIDTMANLLEFAKRTNVKRIIYLSTIGIYGEFRDKVITEDSDRINPGAYGTTKYVAECLLRATEGIEGICLRMPGIIGKGSRGGWLSNTVEKFRRNEDVTIYTPEFQTKNFVWIEDLVSFVSKLIRLNKWKYNAVNLACTESASVQEIVSEIKKLSQSSSKIMVDDNIRQSFCLENSLAVEMGYKSFTPVEIVHKYLKG